MTDIKLENEERPELVAKLSELEILKQSLDEAKLKEKSIYDQLLRLGAEFDNYRKKAEQRVIDARKSGRADVLLEVISLSDALIQAELSSQKATDINSLKIGIRMVLSQYEKFLKDQGVAPIESVGKKMDPFFHDAIAQEEKEDTEEGTVIEEIQRGYSLNGQVLRPAKVKVVIKSNGKEQ